MSAAHTPGPWVYIDASTRAEMQYRKLCIIRGGGKQIADFSWQTPSRAFPSKEESQANARLIAAAPALLEALEEISGLSMSMFATTGSMAAEAKRIAEEAVSLAKGESA